MDNPEKLAIRRWCPGGGGGTGPDPPGGTFLSSTREQSALRTCTKASLGKSAVLSNSLEPADCTAAISDDICCAYDPSVELDWARGKVLDLGSRDGGLPPVPAKALSANCNVSIMMLQEFSRVGPKAIARFNNARKQSRFLTFSVGSPESIDARLRSGKKLVAWLTILSTLRRPLALLKKDGVWEVCEPAEGITAVNRFGGMADLPKVVRNASLGVVILRSPATWVNFWNDRTSER
jgi:hypothetical protein